MCVIAVCKKRKPRKDELEKMQSVNPDGGGVAWYEDGRTKWSKGLNHKEINKIITEIELPFVVHFRISTAGGTPKELCHPFLIKENSPLILKGETTESALLFHNGHVNDWEDMVKYMSGDRLIPSGKWNDTRALAWLMSFKGHNLLNFLSASNKFVICYPNKQIRTLGTWDNVNGIYCSNNYWQFDRQAYTQTGFHNDLMGYQGSGYQGSGYQGHPEYKTIKNEIERYKQEHKDGLVTETEAYYD